jgi:UDP-N-acetylglucosamine 4,6-dehydratase
MFDGKSILVTGGTGSFGKQFIQTLLQNYEPDRLIVLSRDELKQYEMRKEPRFSGPKSKCLRFFIGDVRDRQRLERAFDGVDIVVHAAALKQVPACEYNPFEAIKTNIHGAQNIIDAAIDKGVERVIALSTDKACNPINLYGATKLCSDKLFVAGNSYVGDKNTRFGVVRYGNVVGSRGSVIPLFLNMRKEGRLTITHPDMTRFWITLPQGVNFVINSLERLRGGEIFIPKIPSMKLVDLAGAIGPECDLEEIGIRPGEKLHEVMISVDDARQTLEFDRHYVIQPQFSWWDAKDNGLEATGSPVEEGFRYSSEVNDEWLTHEQLRDIIRPIEEELEAKA